MVASCHATKDITAAARAQSDRQSAHAFGEVGCSNEEVEAQSQPFRIIGANKEEDASSSNGATPRAAGTIGEVKRVVNLYQHNTPCRYLSLYCA